MGKGKTDTAKSIELTMKFSACLIPMVKIISIIYLNASTSCIFSNNGLVIGVIGYVIFIISVITIKYS